MAARKKRALTPEEQLDAALVPESEWPYEVPDNWCWTRIRNIADIVTGNTPSKKRADYYGSSIPFFKPADLDAGRHVSEPSEYLSEAGGEVARIVPAYSTAVCCIGSIGKCGYLEVDGCTNQQINTAVPKIDPLYLYYYMTSEYFVRQLWEKSSATTISIVNKGKMSEVCIPLPPLHEQRRIASRIEWLFAKLDDAEAELREVIDCSEQRRAAILHKAFTGELVSLGDDNERSRLHVPIREVVSGLKYGTSEKSTYDNEGMPVLRIPNVSSLHVDLNDMKYLAHSDVKPADMLQEGDILMIRSNGSRDLVGRCAVVPTLDEEYTYASFLIRIRPSDRVDSKYLWYYLQSPDAKAQLFTKAKSSSGIHNINSKEIGATIMPLPAMDKQHAIVQALDALFDSERDVRSTATIALDRIRMTRESVLNKTLRGELGTNDQNESNSKELLASIFSGNAG